MRLRLIEEKKAICRECGWTNKMPNQCANTYCSAEPNSPHEASAADYAEALMDPEGECPRGLWPQVEFTISA